MNDETVEVPVELLSEWADQAPHIVAANIRSYIPKPKPRIVAVDLDDSRMHGPHFMVEEYLAAQPALLDVLDGVIDEFVGFGIAEWRDADIKERIRAALGVSDET